MRTLLAQVVNIEGNGGSNVSIEGPVNFKFGSDSIGVIVGQALPYIFAAAGIGLLLMIISSGFSIMTSAGDAKKLAQGRMTLTNSIVGFILIFGAFWIVQILGVILGWESSIGQIFQ
jgi:hypothetical protein